MSQNENVKSYRLTPGFFLLCVFPADSDAPAGGGNGVGISPDGYAETNFHVVQPCGPTMKCAMSDEKLYDTIVVGLDLIGDIALIKLLGRSDFPHATFADSNSVTVGAAVNPGKSGGWSPLDSKRSGD